jgi:aspartate aminotransferase
VRPAGAFYLFPHFRLKGVALRRRGLRTSRQLCQRLLADTGVAILPGQDFGRPPEELTARLSYVDFDGARALEAVAALPAGIELDEAFLTAYCGDVLEAVEKICDWVQG